MEKLVKAFQDSGTIVQAGRNTVKMIEDAGSRISVKSFKIPNPFNALVYRYIRSSKARRSYENARKLLVMGINTPKPIGYLEYGGLLGIRQTYYACEHRAMAVTLRDVLSGEGFPDKGVIMAQYAAFMFDLHQKGIEFKDSTPGNFLVEKVAEGKYAFYLVDINRMKFHGTPLSFFARMKNLSKLTEETAVLRQLEQLYSGFYTRDTDRIYPTILYYRSRYNMYLFHKGLFRNRVSAVRDALYRGHGSAM